MKKRIGNKQILIMVLLLVFILIFGITYALKPDSVFKNMLGNKIFIDTDAYGETYLDTSNLELLPILDKDIVKKENVIYINFFVGGASDNDVDNIVYDIALNDLQVDCDLLSSYVKWKLLKNNKEISNGSLDYHFDTIQNGRLILTNIQQDLPKYSKTRIGYDYYEFYLWLSDACQDENILNCKNQNMQNNLLNKKIKGKIEVELYAYKKVRLKRNPSKSLDFGTCINDKSN